MTSTISETMNDAYRLGRDEIDHFHREGFLGPYMLCTPREMDDLRAQLEQRGITDESYRAHQSRHLDQRLVYDLCVHPAVIERIACLIGPDLTLWRSNFFNKEPGDKEIPWHQDINYWPIEPALNISAWLAIDAVTAENSCVQVIPGSHRTMVPHIPATKDQKFKEQADPAYIDTSKAVNMELKPGEFFLFTERLLHHSEPNRSNKRRLGLSVRVTMPFVKVESEQLFKGHGVILVRGVDHYGFNHMVSPPQA